MSNMLSDYTTNELQDELASRGEHGIYWHADDVQLQAIIKNIPITHDEADALMAGIINNHNATIGVTWDTIDMYLETNHTTH